MPNFNGNDIKSITFGDKTIKIAYYNNNKIYAKKYPVTFTAGDYAMDAFTSTSSSATTGNESGTEYEYGQTVYYYVDKHANTAQYTYTCSGTLISGNIYRLGSVVIAGATNLGALSSITRTTNKYAVNFTLGDYVTDAFTSTNSSATSGNSSGTTYNYGTRVYYFVTKYADTAQYIYTCSGTQVSGNVYRLGYIDVNGSNGNLGTLSSVTRTPNIIDYGVTIAFITAGVVAPYYICSSYEDYQEMISSSGGLGPYVVIEDFIMKTVSGSATSITVTDMELNDICMPLGYNYPYSSITINVNPNNVNYYIGVYVEEDK